MARYNISLPEYVCKLADERASALGISRSAFIATAVQFKAQYDDMMEQVPKMMKMAEDLKNGTITVDQMRVATGSSATDVAHRGGEGEA